VRALEGQKMEHLISQEWLQEHLNDPDLVIIDCTNFSDWSESDAMYLTTSAHGHWVEEHIVGSRHADFTQEGFTGEKSRFRNTIPDPQDFADAMARLGVYEGARVILYDDAALQWATRVWWMLRWIGVDKAFVLDGGWVSWDDAGGAVSDKPVTYPPGKLTAKPRPDMFCNITDVKAAMKNGTPLIDALSVEQFEGRENVLGLSGHIPGAVNIPGKSLVSPIDDSFYPLEELEGQFPWPKDEKVMLYCGSGIAAAAVAHVMVRLGYEDITIYMPGLQEWIADKDAPMVHRP